MPWCGRCKQELPVESFPRTNHRRCRACFTESMREYRRSGYAKVESARYQNDPEHRKRANARTLVNMRIRRGKLQRQPCEACGSASSQAHHEDYNKPLEIRWLCSKCHGMEHATADKCRRRSLQLANENHETFATVWWADAPLIGKP